MKMRALRLTLFVAACCGVPAAAADLASDAKAFGARDSVVAPDLSADGTHVIYVTPGPGRKSIAVIGDLATGKFTIVGSADGNPDILRQCNFVSLDRVICKMSGTVKNNVVELLGFSRLVSLNSDGKDTKLLGQTDSIYDASIRQVDANVVDWLDGTDNKVLLERSYVPEEGKIGTRFVRSKKGLGVDRVDARTLASETVEEPHPGASGFMSDGRGHVRLMSSAETLTDGTLSGKTTYLYRAIGSNGWRTLGTFDDENFQPLAIDGDTNQLYALKKNDGRFALDTIKLDGSSLETLVAEHPSVDIEDVVRFGDGQRVIGYTYVEAKRSTVYFDPEFKSLAAALSKALPALPLVTFVDSSHDGRKLLIHAGSDSDPGRYYVFDRDRKTLTLAMVDRPELEGRALASVQSVSITAADGAKIPAYLTLPPGKSGTGLPAVILPHGGPSARDVWGFDWLAQFLAARGYAVLQPEYRGSAGFGDAWLNKNGFKNWRTSIGDISDSAKWMVARGIADPHRMAILGWSYGGYAALQSAVTEPTLYRSVIAIAPVTDLEMLRTDFRGFTIEGLVQKEIGNGPHIFEGSPLRHAAQITAPVLLVHGDFDTNVRIAHSEKLNSALKSVGKESELVRFAGLDHHLDDSDARAQMLTKIGELLERTIGH